MPRIDGYFDKQDGRAGLKTLLGWPLALAVILNAATPVLRAPAAIPTNLIEGFRHYPIVVLYVAVAATVFFFSSKEIRGEFLTARDLALPGLHWVTFAAMTLFRLVQEGGSRDYLLVDAAALYALAMIMFYPRYVARKHAVNASWVRDTRVTSATVEVR